MDLLAASTNCYLYSLQPVWIEAAVSVMDAPKPLTQKSGFTFSYVTIDVTLGTNPEKGPEKRELLRERKTTSNGIQ